MTEQQRAWERYVELDRIKKEIEVRGATRSAEHHEAELAADDAYADYCEIRDRS